VTDLLVGEDFTGIPDVAADVDSDGIVELLRHKGMLRLAGPIYREMTVEFSSLLCPC
jgi:hypothetical protein